MGAKIISLRERACIKNNKEKSLLLSSSRNDDVTIRVTATSSDW
jgi:hypothetical protein